MNTTRKTILAVAVTSVMAFTGAQAVIAADAAPQIGSGMQHHRAMQNRPQLDEATKKACNAFLQETTELRKSMFVKQAEKRALMMGENPDPAQAAKLAGELFDIREQLRTKALAAGLSPRMIMQHMGMTGMKKMGKMAQMGCGGGSPMSGRPHHGTGMM
jgi:zinc resistance-associated protein